MAHYIALHRRTLTRSHKAYSYMRELERDVNNNSKNIRSNERVRRDDGFGMFEKVPWQS